MIVLESPEQTPLLQEVGIDYFTAEPNLSRHHAYSFLATSSQVQELRDRARVFPAEDYRRAHRKLQFRVEERVLTVAF